MSDLPSVTIVIEWENAVDTEDEWAQRAVAGLERELVATAPRMPSKPVVSYLYDRNLVDPEAIRRTIAAGTTQLMDIAEVEVVPTAGMTYYELKNFGVARARTDIAIILDSDAGPEPGWLEGMIRPFADPKIMAVGGITVLGYEDLMSRTFALIWIFGLREEAQKTAAKRGIYANNTAVRSAFLREHPFPRLNAFKKQCVFWLRDILKQGYGYVRVADAVTIHAPHPGVKFILWRAWVTGLDRDFHGYHLVTRSRIGRLGYAVRFFVEKMGRSWWRIWTKGRRVGLPVWQMPGAMAITLVFFSVVFAAQLKSAVSRRHEALPMPDRAPVLAAHPTT